MTDQGSGGFGVILCHTCQKPVRFAATNVEHLDGSALCIESVPLTDNHHLPECWVKHESDPSAWCLCDELRACEERVKDEALAQSRAREVNGVTFAQAWALATNACIDAFYSRISDSDLNDLLSDDEKDIVAQAIRSARQKGN